MAKMAVIGSMNMDVVVRVDEFPLPGQTVSGQDVTFYPGGKGANQCVAVKRFGGDVVMCGMIGRDGNGDALFSLFRAEKIPTDYLFRCDKPTGIAQIQINEKGQNTIVVVPSANYAFGMEEVDKIDGVLQETDYVLLQMELRRDVTEDVIRRAHAYGKTVLLNPAPAAPIDETVLGMVDYLLPNETELAVLTGLPTETDKQLEVAADLLVKKGVKTVVVTLGKRGAMVKTKTDTAFVNGFQVKAVDTVAAGDSFCGAFAVSLSEGKSVLEAVGLANAMGALTVGVKGAIPSLHTRAEVEAFLASADIHG